MDGPKKHPSDMTELETDDRGRPCVDHLLEEPQRLEGCCTTVAEFVGHLEVIVRCLEVMKRNTFLVIGDDDD